MYLYTKRIILLNFPKIKLDINLKIILLDQNNFVRSKNYNKKFKHNKSKKILILQLA